jgi:glyoxylase-like metal-dependent hydrolase (beta-lactamase superfamily II)
MRNETPRLRCEVLDTGYCVIPESLLIRGGTSRKVACHSIVALIQHPQHGWLLWDAGYAPHLLDATANSLFWLYRLATPLRLDPALAVVNQLPRFGLQPADIGLILISHFHADHISGLRDFQAAGYVATQSAYADVAPRTGFKALQRGFIPALLPRDFRERARLLPAFHGTALPHLGPTHDLFGDGSLLLVQLPGHARGQMGLLAETERGRVLFAADGCWLSRSIFERRPPSRLTNLIVDDGRAVRDTIDRLHEFTRAQPDVIVVPSHCPVAFQREVGHAA